MHIGRKILEEIDSTLDNKYHIYIEQADWEPFKQSLLLDASGVIDRLAFEDRQERSISIIERILDRHGKVDVARFLSRLATLEPRIQQVQPWVRDHVVHAINTFILGVYILERVECPPRRNVRYHYQFMWKLCGPTHDLGYPIEIAHNVRNLFVDEMNDILNSIDSPSSRVVSGAYPGNLDKLCDDIGANEIIQERLDDWGLGVDVQNFYSWLQHNNRIDHGVVSALAQLKVIDALYYRANPNREHTDIITDGLNFNQTNFDLDIVSACSALFVHNIDRCYPGFTNRISFDIAPLAFLLFLCDTFQEWDRYAENRSVYSGNDFDISCSSDSISLRVPEELQEDMAEALRRRLSGLTVTVNGEDAVS